MLIALTIGGFMIALTVFFHALALDFILRRVRKLEMLALRRFGTVGKALILAIVVLGVFLVLVCEIWMWALLFYFAPAQQTYDLESALYFSTAMFTTAGSADILLDKGWRLLGVVESANGFLLFGWSTAFIFEIVSKIYRTEGRAIEK